MRQEGRNVMVQGRIVQVYGDLFKGDLAKIFGTKTPKLNKQGQQYQQYGFSLAVPKSILQDPANFAPGKPGEFYQAMHEEAYRLFPDRRIPPTFNMKMKDGDTGINRDGTQLSTKPGHAGNMILSLKTTFPIKFYRYENGQNIQINEGIRCGDYVNVQMNIQINAGTNHSLYLNPNAVQFLLRGEEIISAPSGDQIFGTTLVAPPPGAVEAPLASPGFIIPPSQVQQAPQAQQYAPPPAAPDYRALPPQFQQQAPQAQQYAPPPAAPTGVPQPPTPLGFPIPK